MRNNPLNPVIANKTQPSVDNVSIMEAIVGDEVLSHRHIYALKSLQPLLALVSCEADEEQFRAFVIVQHQWIKPTSFSI